MIYRPVVAAGISLVTMLVKPFDRFPNRIRWIYATGYILLVGAVVALCIQPSIAVFVILTCNIAYFNLIFCTIPFILVAPAQINL